MKDVLDGNLLPQLCINVRSLASKESMAIASSMALTSGTLGVVLDVLSLLDEFVLGRGAGKTALGRGAQLRGKARDVAGG